MDLFPIFAVTALALLIGIGIGYNLKRLICSRGTNNKKLWDYVKSLKESGHTVIPAEHASGHPAQSSDESQADHQQGMKTFTKAEKQALVTDAYKAQNKLNQIIKDCSSAGLTTSLGQGIMNRPIQVELVFHEIIWYHPPVVEQPQAPGSANPGGSGN